MGKCSKSNKLFSKGMKMKIGGESLGPVKLKDIKPGKLFIYLDSVNSFESQVYMKTSDFFQNHLEINAARQIDGELCHIDEETIVIKVEEEFLRFQPVI